MAPWLDLGENLVLQRRGAVPKRSWAVTTVCELHFGCITYSKVSLGGDTQHVTLKFSCRV
jgi:hypothetical protein